MVKVMGPAFDIAYSPLLRKRRKKTIEALLTPPTYVTDVNPFTPRHIDWYFDRPTTLTDSNEPELKIKSLTPIICTQMTPSQIRVTFAEDIFVNDAWSITDPCNNLATDAFVAFPQSGIVQAP